MRRLSGPLDVKFINKTFFPKDYKRPSLINQGRCFLWAYIAWRLYRNLKLCDMGSHAFVQSKKTKKFYDSQRPKGERSWKDLPATYFGHGCGCKRCLKGRKTYRTAGEFKRSWTVMSDIYKVDWCKLNRKIEDVLTCEPTIRPSLVV